NCHSFDDCVGIAFKNRTVHECTRVAFVCVTANIFLSAFYKVLCKKPLTAGGESAAASSAKTGVENALNYVIRSHFGKYLAESLISVGSNVFFDIFGIYYTAVS